jgi:hypothetical protein
MLSGAAISQHLDLQPGVDKPPYQVICPENRRTRVPLQRAIRPAAWAGLGVERAIAIAIEPTIFSLGRK